MKKHVDGVARSCSYQLRQLRSIRRSMPTDLCALLSTPSTQAASTTATQSCTGLLTRSFGDYYAAARVITGVRRNDHITPTLRDTLHWLPVSQRIIFKIALMTYVSIRGRSPAYFRDTCVSVVSVAFCSRLRSADRDMIVPGTRTTRYGPRSFRVVAPQIWNSLPSYLKDIHNSREQFKLSLVLALRASLLTGGASENFV